MAGKKVLVVDDDEDLLTLLEHDLRKHDYEVTTASSGEEGIQVLHSLTPDLVILDNKMPGMAGEEMVERIKSINPNVPIVLYSNYVQDEKLKQSLLDKGVKKVISKEVSREDLINQLSDL